MKRGYKQHNRSELWNRTHRVKRLYVMNTSRYVNLPKDWIRELNLGEVCLLTLDNGKGEIIIKALPKDEEFILPQNQPQEEGWIDEAASESDSGESRIY